MSLLRRTGLDDVDERASRPHIQAVAAHEGEDPVPWPRSCASRSVLVLTPHMTQPPDSDPNGVAPDEERCVVLLHGSRATARMFGSVTGPTVLAPGPSSGWQVLHLLPGSEPGPAIVQVITSGLASRYEVEEPQALSLHRSGATRLVLVSASGTLWTRAWGAQLLDNLDADEAGLEQLAEHLAAMTTDVAPQDVLDVLRDRRTDGQPLHELASLLGLPTEAVDALESDHDVAPDDGELLVRADRLLHARKMLSAPRGEPGASSAAAHEARFSPEAMTRIGDRLFGFVYVILGAGIGITGALCLQLGIRTEATLLGLGHPGAWLVLSAVLVCLGLAQLRRRGRGAREAG